MCLLQGFLVCVFIVGHAALFVFIMQLLCKNEIILKSAIFCTEVLCCFDEIVHYLQRAF